MHWDIECDPHTKQQTIRDTCDTWTPYHSDQCHPDI